MIEALQGFPDNVLAFVCHGQVTSADYETAPDLSGIDASAMWEDTKVGICGESGKDDCPPRRDAILAQ